ncbi:MAG: AhpC/TSA family protein [Bacteroidales bacterium]|nr:AhpC/TSA family protein [Bacteroidales bacterium]
MKNILIATGVVTMILSSCTGQQHTISGKLENSPAESYIFLDELKADAIVTVDSVMIDDSGEFKFRRKSKDPLFYMLKANDNSFLTVLIDPGENLRIEADYDSLNVPRLAEGADGTEKILLYNIELRKAIAGLEELQGVYMANLENPELDKVIGELDVRAAAIIEGIGEYTKTFIDENPTSLASLIALYQQVSPGMYVLHPVDNIDYFLKVDSTLFALYPESEPVKSFHEQVAELKLSMGEQSAPAELFSTGSVPPEIALPDVKGDTIRLSSTRGKVVLLDFWAAWCPPCRQESPVLVRAYDKYNSKGFEIFQVSLDRTREEWIKGIEDDKLGRWIHVSDVMYWNSVVVPMYKIESIPFNMLLDRDGRIIQTNLRGEQLIEVLESVMNQ